MQRRNFLSSLLLAPAAAKGLDVEVVRIKPDLPPTPLAVINFPQAGDITIGETALTVISDALREIGALAIDEIPCHEDAEFALRKLRLIARPQHILSGSPLFGLDDIVAAQLVYPLAECLRIPFCRFAKFEIPEKG